MCETCAIPPLSADWVIGMRDAESHFGESTVPRIGLLPNAFCRVFALRIRHSCASRTRLGVVEHSSKRVRWQLRTYVLVLVFWNVQSTSSWTMRAAGLCLCLTCYSVDYSYYCYILLLLIIIVMGRISLLSSASHYRWWQRLWNKRSICAPANLHCSTVATTLRSLLEMESQFR